MAAGETIAAQQRHQDIFNTKPVYGLLFDLNPRIVGADKLAELAYVLAGVGGTPRHHGGLAETVGDMATRDGVVRPLRLRVQPTLAPHSEVPASNE